MFWECLLVTVDYLLGVVVEVSESDESAALAGLSGVGNGIGLGVAVEGWFGLFGEDAIFAPCVEVLGCAGVDVMGVRNVKSIVGLVFSEDDSDEVVRAGFVVPLLHGRRDLVVGLGDDIFHVDAVCVVTECAERVDTGHAGQVLQVVGLR